MYKLPKTITTAPIETMISSLIDWKEEQEKKGFVPTVQMLIEELEEELKK